MAFTKIASPSDWPTMKIDAPTCTVKISSRGLMPVDAATLSKLAGDQFVDAVKKVEGELRKDCQYVHAVSCGASDYFGPNRNADGWRAEVLERDMPTYVKHAKLFREHVNRKDSPYYGRIKLAFYDKERGYGRVLAEYNATKKAADELGGLVADKELEKLAKDGHICVSHGCFVDPSYPVLTKDRGYVSISELTTDDSVWTHRGRWRKVTAVTTRQYTGDVYKISLHGMSPLAFEITANHPTWTRKAVVTKLKNGTQRYFAQPGSVESVSTEWMCAEHVEKGDLMFHSPVVKYEGYMSIDDINLATIMGAYVAEGSIGDCNGKPNTVQFSCHINDSFPANIQRMIDESWPGVKAGFGPSHSSNLGVSVRLHSAELAAFLGKLCRRGAHNKQIPPEIFNSSDEIKLAFLGAWIDGDGCVDKKGCRIVTCSNRLALQCRDLLATMGITSSIWLNSNGLGANSVATRPTTAYATAISWLHLSKLKDVSTKVANSSFLRDSNESKSTAARKMEDGSFGYSVRSVTKRFVENTTVYNCEVEEDESFSAAGISTHNSTVGSDTCIHCGNVATKKAEYCLPKNEGGTCTLFGCRHGMSKVAEDGRTQYVDNPKNVFYDLSFVGTPADRIAYGLGVKTASLSDVVYEPRYDLLGLDAYSDFDAKIVKAALDLAAYEAKYAINDVGNEDLHKLAAFNSVLGDPKQKASLDGLVHPDPYVKRGAAHTLAKNKQLPSAGKMAKAAGFSDPDAAICDAISVGLIERLVSQDKLAALLDSSDFTSGRLAANSHFYAICASAPGYSFDSDSLTKRAHLEAISESTVYKFPEIPVQVDPGLVRMACDHAALKIAMVAQFFPDDVDTLTLFACPRRS